MRDSNHDYQFNAGEIPPWSDIDTVMFDMDGTLLDLHFDNYFWQDLVPRIWGRQAGLEPEEAMARLSEMYQKMRGTLEWYCLDFWAQELDLNITALKHDVRHKIAIRPNVTELLDKLGNLQKRILLITNAHTREPGAEAATNRHWPLFPQHHQFSQPETGEGKPWLLGGLAADRALRSISNAAH